MNQRSRRSLLKATAISVVSIGGLSSIATASNEKALRKKYEAWDDAYELYADEYGREEAQVIVEVFSDYVQEYERNKLSADKAVEKAWLQIAQDPLTKQVSADIHDHLEFKETLEKQIRDPSDEPSFDAESATVQQETELELNNSYEDGSSPLSGSWDTSVRTEDDDGEARMRGYCGTVVGGSAEYVIRLYSDARGNTGDIQLNVDYRYRGNTTSTVGDASTELFLFVETFDGDVIKSYVEGLGTSGENSQSAQFTVPDDAGGAFYGVELRASASAIVEYTYSDYYGRDFRGRRRRVNVDNLTLQDL